MTGHPMDAWWAAQATPRHIPLTVPAGAGWDDLRDIEETA